MLQFLPHWATATLPVTHALARPASSRTHFWLKVTTDATISWIGTDFAGKGPRVRSKLTERAAEN